LSSGFDDAGGKTAQGGEILWAVTGADGGAILIPIPVESVVAAVFNGPMAAIIRQHAAALAVWGVWLVMP